jgi:MFS family permease
MLFGLWQVALPDLQADLRLSAGALGAALTTGFLAAFPVMLAGGRLADWWGNGRIVGVSALLIALAFAGLVGVQSYLGLAGLLLIFYGATGAYDVGMNAAAIAAEQASGEGWLPYYHAAFSGGSAVGAVLAGGLLWFGLPFRWLYLGVTVGMGLMALAAWRGSWPARPVSLEASAPSPASRGLYRSPALWLLAVITALGFLSEGTLENWSAFYLRSALRLPASLGAAGPAVFHTAMLVGRLSTGALMRRLGRPMLLRAAGALAAGGMVLALATPHPAVTLAGLLLAGLALASVAPVAFSLAGDAAPQRLGAVSAFITTIGYSGFLAGPALIGGLTEWLGIRFALGSLVAAGVLIVGLEWLRGRMPASAAR